MIVNERRNIIIHSFLQKKKIDPSEYQFLRLIQVFESS